MKTRIVGKMLLVIPIAALCTLTTGTAWGAENPVPLINQPLVQLNPASLNFPLEHCHSATLLTRLTNVGTATLSITGITTSGYPFSQTNNCNSSLMSGQSCTITVTFYPFEGNRLVHYTGTVSISDNGGGSPQLVPLSGWGEGCFYGE